MLAAGLTKSQRWTCSNVEEEYNAPFQSHKPFFSSSEKPPLSSSLSPLIFFAKCSCSCFLSWEDGNETAGRQELRRERQTEGKRRLTLGCYRHRVNCFVSQWKRRVKIWGLHQVKGRRQHKIRKCSLVLISPIEWNNVCVIFLGDQKLPSGVKWFKGILSPHLVSTHSNTHTHTYTH